MKKITLTSLLTIICISLAFSQNLEKKTNRNTGSDLKFSISTTYLTLANFGPEKTNTHHYEFHFGY